MRARRPTFRRRACSAARSRNDARTEAGGATATWPVPPSKAIGVPAGMSRTAGPRPTTAGIPRVRARIAPCDVGLPYASSTPVTCPGSSSAASAGVRSAAISTPEPCAAVPGTASSARTTRSPTARTSADRACRYGSSSASNSPAIRADRGRPGLWSGGVALDPGAHVVEQVRRRPAAAGARRRSPRRCPRHRGPYALGCAGYPAGPQPAPRWIRPHSAVGPCDGRSGISAGARCAYQAGPIPMPGDAACPASARAFRRRPDGGRRHPRRVVSPKPRAASATT